MLLGAEMSLKEVSSLRHDLSEMQYLSPQLLPSLSDSWLTCGEHLFFCCAFWLYNFCHGACSL